MMRPLFQDAPVLPAPQGVPMQPPGSALAAALASQGRNFQQPRQDQFAGAGAALMDMLRRQGDYATFSNPAVRPDGPMTDAILSAPANRNQTGVAVATPLADRIRAFGRDMYDPIAPGVPSPGSPGMPGQNTPGIGSWAQSAWSGLGRMFGQ